MRKLLFALVLAVLAFGPSRAQDFANAFAGGVNWQHQTVRATGFGAPNPNVPMGAQRAGALRAAKLDALRNLLEVVKGMYITSETTVRNAMAGNDYVHAQVQGIVRGFSTVDVRYMSTGDLEVDVEVPLSAFYELINPPRSPEMPAYQDSRQPDSYQALPASNSIYTGLIVDTRGLGVQPALSPRILDETKAELYGSLAVTREFAIRYGVVGYESDLDRATKAERSGNNPLVVRAIAAAGVHKSDVIISQKDAQLLRELSQNLNFLDECKVMFVIDQ